MIVAKAVKKFERLAKLCPYLVPTEEQRVKQMLEMFRPDISLSVEGGGDPMKNHRCFNVDSEGRIKRLSKEKLDRMEKGKAKMGEEAFEEEDQ